MAKLDHLQTAAWLMEHDEFLLLTHVRPDGDTVGCAAALCRALRRQGKRAFVLPDPGLSDLFTDYLEGLYPPADYTPDTVVAVDMAARSMFHEGAKPYLDRVDLTIDHHPSQEFYAAHTCLDASRAACGELVYDIVRQWGELTPEVALPLYVAVSTDTGCFVYSNTSAGTHWVAAALMETGIDFYAVNRLHFRTKSFKRLKLESMLTAGLQLFDDGATAIVTLTLDMMEQLNATEEDVDNISAFVGQIQGVRTGITIRQLTPGQCKLSVRTEPGELNASQVCGLLGGGGHAAAAGATVDGTPEQAQDQILSAVRRVRGF